MIEVKPGASGFIVQEVRCGTVQKTHGRTSAAEATELVGQLLHEMEVAMNDALTASDSKERVR